MKAVGLAGVALVVALGPAVALAAGATGLVVVSAAAVPDSCATASADPTANDEFADCELPATAPPLIPGGTIGSGSDSRGAQAALAAVTAVGRGGRYVAEGNGPVDFDCSGLTAWAWRQAGLSLPDYSYSQWDSTMRISRDQLVPGDLVFWFGGDVHHVAIVVAVDAGRVRIAEAANPAAGLRIRNLGDSWDQAYLSGYGRVLRA
jgi:cell wall-associated NlpC family hydrolase